MRNRIVELAALGLSIGLAPTLALAQSVDLPLNYAVNTDHNYGSKIASPVLILTINVGVNGGAAQPYAFDTGSSVFLTPSGVFTGGTSSVLASGVHIDTYGGAGSFSGDLYQVTASSLKFYAAPGATSGGISLQSSGNYNAASYTSLNGQVPTFPPFGTAAIGVFGADAQAFTVSGTSVGLGGVFGQTVLPNTTAGYVVAANGQSLSALNSQLGTSIPGGPVTSAQQSVQTVPRSVTSCNPCVTVGLTPALVAQFLPLNTVSAAPSGSPTPFPNSNVPGIGKFVPFNFTLSSSSTPGNTEQFSRNVSLDSGWTDFTLVHSSNLPDPVLTIAANGGGTQETFNIASSPGMPSPYRLSNSNDGSNFLGTGFFVRNSVLFDLAGQQVGYSPNFVTDANITTTSSSPLIVDASSVPLGLAGVISGPGGISISTGGSATLSGTNTYTGPTSVSGGYLAVVGPGSIATSRSLSVSAGGMFDISGTGGGASIRSLAGDQNGLVWLGSQALTITAAQDAFAGTIAGSGGLTLTGGVEALTGTNTYAGATTVNGGVLDVEGTITNSSRVTVGAGGMLTGTGTIDPPAVTVSSGGILAPGASGVPGTFMTIAGNLVFQSGALYAVYLNATTSSFANVTGTASLAGTVNANFGAGGSVKKQYVILQSSGISSTFSGLTTTNLPAGFAASLAYTDDYVFLNLVGALPAQSVNQQNVANSLSNYFNAGGALPPNFANIFGLTGGALGSALTQLDGENATGAERGAFQIMTQFLGLMLDPFVNGRGAGSGATAGVAAGFAPEEQANLAPDIALAYASVLTKAPPRQRFDQRWTAWGSAYGGSSSGNGDPTMGSSNVTAQSYGFAAGMDYHLSADTRIGFALAGAGLNWGLANGLGSGRSDAFQGGVYGITHWGPAYIAGALAFTNHWFTTDRAPLGDRLTASFDGQSYGARLEGGYRFGVLPTLGVTPYAALQAQDFRTPNYSETDVNGGGFGLSYAAMNAGDVRSELGTRFETPTLVFGVPVIVRGRIAWAHDFVSNPGLSAVFQTLPGSGFMVGGAPIPHDSVLTSAGAELLLKPGWTLLAKFDDEFANGSQTYAGTGTLRYSW